MPIKCINARQIFDSKGIPTVEVDLITELGLFRAAVPSGTATGDIEALEIRDNDKAHYNGLSVMKAVDNVNNVIAPELLKQNVEVTQQGEIDDFLIQLDGTPNKSKLGANAIFGVSLAVCKAGAAKRGVPLYRHIADLAKNTNIILPVPVFNVINGGTSSANKLPMQEFLILPTGAENFAQAMKMGTEVYQRLKKAIETKYGLDATCVGNEGGFSPKIPKPKDALKMINDAIKKSGYGGRVEIGMNIAASAFLKSGKYDMDFKNKKSAKSKWLTPVKLAALYMSFIKDFPVVSIEDPFHREDWKAWIDITNKTEIQIMGNALTASNVDRIQMAIDQSACNGFVLMVNQCGTITESITAYNLARANGWGTLISHRQGETEDTFIADLAVGLSTGQIKTGGPCRTDQLGKYNQLLRIEEELGDKAKYAGKAFRRPTS